MFFPCQQSHDRLDLCVTAASCPYEKLCFLLTLSYQFTQKEGEKDRLAQGMWDQVLLFPSIFSGDTVLWKPNQSSHLVPFPSLAK